MGTHSLILFQTRTSDGECIKYIIVYQQFDGYPAGVGMQLVDFIESKKMVNGYTDKYTQANGFSCLIAQYIAENKDGAGNLYVYPSTYYLNEEYVYIVTYDEGTHEFSVKVDDNEEMDLVTFRNFCDPADSPEPEPAELDNEITI